MATVISGKSIRADGEAAFFFAMAIAMTATAIIGFGLNALLGRSSFGAPWWVHVHGVTMMGWMAIYLVQNALIYRGDLTLHRRLGKYAAFYIAWMMLVGLILTPTSIAAGRTPPFFDPGQFLALDWLNILIFGGLAYVAVAMRKRTDWHRRLMLVGTISLMGPPWGRLLPMPFMGWWKLWAILAVLLVYLVVAIVHDLRTRGRIHPAYLWGGVALFLSVALIDPLGHSPAFLALTDALMG